jgi:uncharacterized repeat protein (TIGR03803 family)
MKSVLFRLYACAVGCALALQFSAMAIAESKETVILKFNHADGAVPVAGLVDVKGTLYGTTAWGPNCSLKSNSGCGTIFSIGPTTTGAETLLYSFCSQKNCTDGQFPAGSLIDVDGTLYGTTQWGGTVNCVDGAYLGCGTVFAFDPNIGMESVVHSFGKGKDGTNVYAGLIHVNGMLYGTTAGGGANCQSNGFGGCGTVFSINPTTGAETVLYSFCSQQNCSDGSEPYAGLVEVKGTLYGTTIAGGANYTECNGYGCGTVFALDLKTGTETVIYSFCSQQNCSDGALPEASLIDVNGTLYGTTTGGDSCCGTVFALNLGTGVETVLHVFCSHPIHHQCLDGANPVAGLIDVKGILYGTTPLGGIYQDGLPGNGVLFSLDPKTGTETVLNAFGRRKNGANSEANLIDVTGTLYGTTAGGGDHDEGTVFKLRP